MLARVGRKALLALVVTSLGLLAWGPSSSFAADRSRLPVLERLRPEINFWKAVFASYSSKQAVFHDRDNLLRIYSALDFSDLEAAGLGPAEFARRKEKAINDEVTRLRELLRGLHAKRGQTSGFTKEERRILRQFSGDPDPLALLHATEDGRIRAQTGMRDRFLRGLQIAQAYLPEMERIFRAAGLPVELTRLPFVESAFNVDAYSKVGAAGIWQFMPGTGRAYMIVTPDVDERRNPITATRAAARHLKGDFEALGSWPLAVTAYNHGRGGMARAVSTMGTEDLVRLVKEYRGPSFGFASRNFYVELLAAVEVVADAKRHFGELLPAPEFETDTVSVPVRARFDALAKASGADADALARMNPALSDRVVEGRAPVPAGYTLYLPAGTGDRFLARADAIPAAPVASREVRPAKAKPSARSGSSARVVRHQVRRGQTLASIARQYKTTVRAIRTHNRLGNDKVVVGQTLLIPRG